MKRLIEEGKSIILITHKLQEIMDVSDRVTVIRKGEGNWNSHYCRDKS